MSFCPGTRRKAWEWPPSTSGPAVAVVTDASPNEGHRESKTFLPYRLCVWPQFSFTSCLPIGAHLTNPTHKAQLCRMWDVCRFPQCQNATMQIKSQYAAPSKHYLPNKYWIFAEHVTTEDYKAGIGNCFEDSWMGSSFLHITFKVTLIKRTARRWKMAILAEGAGRWEAALSWKVCESHFCHYLFKKRKRNRKKKNQETYFKVLILLFSERLLGYNKNPQAFPSHVTTLERRITL